jgi:hypothetical protein
VSSLIKTVWVFHGSGGRFSSGVFSDLQKAEEWIKNNKLSGMLTEYPIDTLIYDWAIKNNHFEVKKESQLEPLFIQNFTCASQEHFHFEGGDKEA